MPNRLWLEVHLSTPTRLSRRKLAEETGKSISKRLMPNERDILAVTGESVGTRRALPLYQQAIPEQDSTELTMMPL